MSGNKSLLRSLSISLLLFTATGCSAHSPFILWKTVDTSSFPNAPSKPPHDRPVFVSDSQVDSAVFDVLANIDVGYAFYGSLIGLVIRSPNARENLVQMLYLRPEFGINLPDLGGIRLRRAAKLRHSSRQQSSISARYRVSTVEVTTAPLPRS